jgi:hypothetical protein
MYHEVEIDVFFLILLATIFITLQVKIHDVKLGFFPSILSKTEMLTGVDFKGKTND